MQVNYRLAVGLFLMGAYKALRPLLICGLYAEKSRLAWNIFGILQLIAWNIFGILQLALDLKRRDSAVFFLFILSFFIQLHCIVIIVVLC